MLTEEEIISLPVRELALRLLQAMGARGSTAVSNLLGQIIASLPPPPTGPGMALRVSGRSWLSEPQLTHPLAEAWDWLYVNGLTACEPDHPSFRFVTRFGRTVLDDPTRLPL